MICRLCLKDITEVINIFDEIGVELNVAAVLGKYFWFEPKSDDPISTAICNSCWISVSNFHEFYLSVEEAHRLLTERFSFSSVEQKARKRRKGVDKERELTFNSKLIKRDADEGAALQFGHLLKNDRTGSATAESETALPTAAKIEESVWHSSYDVDEFSMDGEAFMDDVLKEENQSSDVLATLKDEPVEQPNVRRSTRSNAATNSAIANESVLQSNDDVSPTKKKESEVDCSASLKKRRGRPPKSSKEGANAQESKLNIKNEQGISGRSSKYEAKMKQLDNKIAQHIRLNCDICGEEQGTFAVLRKHMEQTHECKAYAKCCNKKFYKRAHLADHIDKHINPECYKCEECDKVFADKQCMRNHFLLKHQPDEDKIYECENCTKKFAKPYLLEQHRAVHNKSTHDCDICHKTFSSANSLSTHIKVIHSNYGTMCDVCAKVIRGRAAFIRHQLEHTGIVQPKVQCDKCGSWHKDKYTLQKHKRRHNDEGKVHVCNICGKVSPNRSALLSHQRYVHVSVRKYECGVCKKAFKKPLNLKEHMTMHTGEVLYNCPHCPKTFNSNANMHSHRKKMHPKEFEETRNNRRENVTNSTVSQQQKTVVAMKNKPVTKVINVMNLNEDSMPQVITIKSDGSDGSETHNLLVTTDDFSDHDDADTSTGDNSIVFTIH